MIKKIVACLSIAFLMATSSQVLAQNGDAEARRFMAQFEYCENIKEVGIGIYSVKQEGIPQSALEKTLNNLQDVPYEYVMMLRKLINVVYNTADGLTEDQVSEVIFFTCMSGIYDMQVKKPY